MTRVPPLVGVLATAQRSHPACSKDSWVRQVAGDAATFYVDDRLAVGAAMVVEVHGVVIAGSPACERDRETLHGFREAWSSGEAFTLDIIERDAVTCALAVYTDGHLAIFRDRLGIDGLYYTSDDLALAFCTELDAFLRPVASDRSLNPASVATFLLSGRPRVGTTLCEGIQSLSAAHFLRSAPDPQAEERYWSPLSNPMPVDSGPARIGRLARHLRRACEESFAPEGNALFLSGGLDSSYIAFVAGQTHRDSTVCYTVGYADDEYSDESSYARVASEAFGLPLRRVELSVADSVRYLLEILDEPHPVSASATICNNALVDAAIADGNVHILSGLGSDEVFANYTKMLHYYFRARELLLALDLDGADLLDHPEPGDDLLFPGVAGFFAPPDLSSMLWSDDGVRVAADDLCRFYRECGPLDLDTHLFSFFVAHECQHRLPDLLLRDFSSHARRSGAHIVYPFLDPSFVQGACSLYPAERFQHYNDKWHSKITMKAIASSYLPRELIERKRGTFNFPFSAYLDHDDFCAVVINRLENSSIWEAGLFKPDTLALYRGAIDLRRAGAEAVDERRWSELWVLLTFSSWYERYISC